VARTNPDDRLDALESRLDQLEAENEQLRSMVAKEEGPSVSRRTALGAVAGLTGLAAAGSASGDSQANLAVDSGSDILDAITSETIVVWEDDGQAVADTEKRRYRGEDILQAAQEAIDEQISNENGELHLKFKSGSYTPDGNTALTIKGSGIRRVYIESNTPYGCKIDCKNFADGKWVFDFDQNQTGQDKLKRFAFRGFHLTDSNSRRAYKGLKTNDVDEISITHTKIRYAKQAAFLGNVFQGEIRYFATDNSGSKTDSLPALKLEGVKGEEVDSIAAASNNMVIDHLQGGPGTQVAYLDCEGQVSRVNITNPEIEMSGDASNSSYPTCFDLSGLRMGTAIKIANPQVKNNGGAGPALVIESGDIKVNGGQLNSSQEVIKPSDNGITKPCRLHLTDVSMSTTDSASDVVTADQSQLFVSGVFITGGNRGIWADGSPHVNITGTTIKGADASGVSMRGVSKPSAIDGVTLIDVAVNSGHPIRVEGGNGMEVSGVSASVGGTRTAEAVLATFTDNIKVDRDSVSTGTDVSAVLRYDSSTSQSRRGTTTLTSGSTSVSVTHNLSGTPTPEDITVTPASGMGSASTWYITNVGSSSFDIAVDADPTQDVTFAWQAEL